VQVINVPLMQNAGVPAAGAVLMRVTLVVSRHVNRLLAGK
jgi:hypothetical protein